VPYSITRHYTPHTVLTHYTPHTVLIHCRYVTEKKSWHPWFVNGQTSAPAGYATTYTVNNASVADASFSFITIRLAGHMVPNFQPAAAETFFTNFLARKAF
jgi:hypothetical protein